ncbi:uncharacterized protein FIBRA_02767 [Fibroporia radiculosa]|uniref:ubiquitinyl hydrolase 1 n=1 Tax=Fibroporia radiculosa TaxID=599839 RepID=J4HVG5_9APHY|nr:uncharacterized protein FIBRA_02767 [Fibroporia radiculosa]CCM00727.1 predicted protein [Fibroporia radiculosa]
MLKHKKNQPTPQEIYRARKQREEEEKDANLPPGLINHGNTCFMNSTLQGLMATELLHNLVNFRSVPASLKSTLGTSIVAQRSPQLTNGHGLGGQYEHAKVEDMPLGDTFIDVMRKGWDIQESQRRESMSPKELLFTMGKKYDQYMDFRQQDAHEFLRHMLDAMRMEEMDIIKKRQPPPPVEESRKRGRKKRMLPPAPISGDDEKLASFVDMLFGGRLASILVCEKCQKVSLTYEDFNDLSLSIKPEDYVKDRKRDRLKQFARKLRGPFRQPGQEGRDRLGHRSSSVPADPLRRSLEVPRPEDDPPLNEGPRRRSIDHVEEEDAEVEEGRNVVRELPKARPTDAIAIEDEELGSGEDKDEKPAELLNYTRVKVDHESKSGKDKESKEKEDPWGKLGRRISVSMRKGMKVLDSGSPSRSVERGRNARTKRVDPITSLKSESADMPHSSPASTIQADDSSRPDLNDALLEAAARLRLASSSPAPNVSSPLRTPPLAVASRPVPSRRSTALSGKRKKSPLAPKPTRQEAAYLKQLLADVQNPSANPLSILHQAFVAGGHSVHITPAAAAWAKIGHLPGIEECLRMFTAVELLDGENMVGCRRCWKIANGTYKLRRRDDIDAEDDDAASEGEESEGSPAKCSADVKTIVAIQDVPATNSRESFFSSPERSASNPTSPTGSTPKSSTSLSDHLSDSTSTTAPTTTGSGSQAPNSPPLDAPNKLDMLSPLVSPTRPTTYSGLPIPLISTTGPESPITSPAHRSETHEALSRPTSPSLGVAFPDNILLAPGGKYRAKTKVDGNTTDDSYDSDSDISVSTSVYSDASSVASLGASPTVSPRASLENLSTGVASSDLSKVASSGASSSKVSRAKQVVLRRMYKRYLISDPPPVLVVHLKRFQQTSKMYSVSFSGGVKKLDEFIAFPELLDLTPFLAPRKEDFGLDKARKSNFKASSAPSRCMYRLYAVVVHIGNMLGGHYVAYTALPPSHPVSKPSASNSSIASEPIVSPNALPQTSIPEQALKPARQWAYISDTVVRLTTIEEVLKAKAYICMYERI